MNIKRCNQLRQQIWDIDEQIGQLLHVPPDFRNTEKIEALEERKLALEAEIARLRREP